MEFSEVIAKRISIRKYKDTPVEPEKIAQLEKEGVTVKDDVARELTEQGL